MLTRLEQKWASKNIDVRPYPNGFMASTVEDSAVLKSLDKFSSFPAVEYDRVLAKLSNFGFSLTVID